MRTVSAIVVAAALGLSAPPTTESAPASGTVTVFAAASLTEAFRAAAQDMHEVHPGVSVDFNFAGSPTLVQQIEQGAFADVVATADEANMLRLGVAHRLAGAPTIFARNRLAIAVEPGNPKKITGLADLAKPGLTVALCAPQVPAGHYAVEAFGKAGVPVPETSREVDVKAVLTRVTLGEADAGVVYVTDIRAAGAKAQAVDIPDAHNVSAPYPLAIVAGAPNPAGAEAFVDFILSARGQALLARFGFGGR